MILTVQSYADFLLVIGVIREPDLLFYWNDITSNNRAFFYSIHADGRVVVLALSTITQLPGSFSTDFPEAIQLAHELGVT